MIIDFAIYQLPANEASQQLMGETLNGMITWTYLCLFEMLIASRPIKHVWNDDQEDNTRDPGGRRDAHLSPECLYRGDVNGP